MARSEQHIKEDMNRNLRRIAQGMEALNLNLVALVKAVRESGFTPTTHELNVDKEQQSLPVLGEIDVEHNYIAMDDTMQRDFENWKKERVTGSENVIWTKPGEAVRVYSKHWKQEGDAQATNSSGQVRVKLVGHEEPVWLDREDLEFLEGN